jgi:broad specificity phosphatase PhoE
MATRVYLVRHGATPLTAENRFSGQVGVDLSDEGRRQVALLATRLKVDDIRAVYASPLTRTLETARILGAPLGLTPVLRDGLREVSHGHWEGLTREEVETRYPGEYALWEQDPYTSAPEGGESGVAVLARALPVVRQIVLAHPDEGVLVVSHKATIRLVLCSLLGIDGRGYRDRLDQSPACLNIVDFRDPVRARLMLFNDTSHYSGRARIPAASLSKWWDDVRKGTSPRGSVPS